MLDVEYGPLDHGTSIRVGELILARARMSEQHVPTFGCLGTHAIVVFSIVGHSRQCAGLRRRESTVRGRGDDVCSASLASSCLAFATYPSARLACYRALLSQGSRQLRPSFCLRVPIDCACYRARTHRLSGLCRRGAEVVGPPSGVGKRPTNSTSHRGWS